MKSKDLSKVLISTPYPTEDEIRKIYGISKKRWEAVVFRQSCYALKIALRSLSAKELAVIGAILVDKKNCVKIMKRSVVDLLVTKLRTQKTT